MVPQCAEDDCWLRRLPGPGQTASMCHCRASTWRLRKPGRGRGRGRSAGWAAGSSGRDRPRGSPPSFLDLFAPL